MQSQQLEKVDKLDIGAASSDLSQVNDYLSQTSLCLPRNASYHVEMREKTLHIYSSNKEIDGYKFADFNEQREVEIRNGNIAIELNNSAVKTVVLHLTPKKPNTLVYPTLSGDVPVELLDRYVELKQRGWSDPKAKLQMRALMKEMSDEFAQRRNTRRRAVSSYSSVSTISYGEGRIGGQRACG